MPVSLRSTLEVVLIIIISIFWCEYAYYHFVFRFHCPEWPGRENLSNSNENLTNLLVIADTHIMGPKKSFRVDKWRREWQMSQGFKISMSIYRPDVVVFMGDLLDEGLTSHDELFDQSCGEFEKIFHIDDRNTERLIIPGNHDIGFHDRMLYFPFLLDRFQRRFRTTATIELVRSSKLEGLNVIATNSMSFFNDSCPICSASFLALAKLQTMLNQTSRLDPDNYSAPILLGHIPLYRKNDLSCVFDESFRHRAREENVEGKDVLHKSATEALKTMLRPKLAISGHTHMQCETTHKNSHALEDNFQEITVTSYNHKYAELEPGFLLLSVGTTQHYIQHCKLIDEVVVISIYFATLIAVVFRLVIAKAGS